MDKEKEHERAEDEKGPHETRMTDDDINLWIYECSDKEELNKRVLHITEPPKRVSRTETLKKMCCNALIQLYQSRCNNEQFYSLHESQFRWVRRYYDEKLQANVGSPIEKGMVRTSMKHMCDKECLLSGGMRYILQLLDNGEAEKWVDWCSIRRSGFNDGTLGLFAERQFPSGACVGVWTGDYIWQHNVQGEIVPDSVVNSMTDVPITNKDFLFFDNKCYYTFMKPCFEWGPHMRLYMGLHFMHNACRKLENTTLNHKAEKMNNCIIENDGMCFALKKIYRNQEMYLGNKSSHKWQQKKRRVDDGQNSNNKTNGPAKKQCVSNTSA